jgi:hypothetical protein
MGEGSSRGTAAEHCASWACRKLSSGWRPLRLQPGRFAMQRFVETVSLALGIMMIAAMVGLVVAATLEPYLPP